MVIKYEKKNYIALKHVIYVYHKYLKTINMTLEEILISKINSVAILYGN